ncbi:Methyl-accepting chemotaxis protein (MCP) signaling domain [Chromobacterium vaccinii]|nr:Methyl-accepting chemotaxis protein (MCP) signaling domain [Chromobacterium vaccinii]
MPQQARSAVDQGVGLARSSASEIEGIDGLMPRAVEAFAQIIYITWGQSTAVGNVVDTTERIEGMTRSASEVSQSASSTLDELNHQATKLRGVVERFHI